MASVINATPRVLRSTVHPPFRYRILDEPGVPVWAAPGDNRVNYLPREV
jgi:hypothetical protein